MVIDLLHESALAVEVPLFKVNTTVLSQEI